MQSNEPSGHYKFFTSQLWCTALVISARIIVVLVLLSSVLACSATTGYFNELYEVHVKVVDRKSGEPEPKTKVWMKEFRSGWLVGHYEIVSEAVTDNDGFAVLRTNDPGPVMVEALPCKSFFAQDSRATFKQEAPPTSPLQIRLTIDRKRCAIQ